MHTSNTVGANKNNQPLIFMCSLIENQSHISKSFLLADMIHQHLKNLAIEAIYFLLCSQFNIPQAQVISPTVITMGVAMLP